VFSDRTKTVLLNALAFRAAKMRSQDHTRAVLDRVFNRRQRRSYARVVVNLPLLDGNVEVDTDKNTLSTKLEIFDG
jgi:hypothetical protein